MQPLGDTTRKIDELEPAWSQAATYAYYLVCFLVPSVMQRSQVGRGGSLDEVTSFPAASPPKNHLLDRRLSCSSCYPRLRWAGGALNSSLAGEQSRSCPTSKLPFGQPLPPRRRILARGSVEQDGGAVSSIVTLTFLFRLKPSWKRYTSLRLCSIFTDFMDPGLQDRRTVFGPFPTCDSPVIEFSLEMDALAFCECRNISAAGSDRSMHFVFPIDAPEKDEAATEGGLPLSVDGEETRNVR
ncbi:hypothetical protein BDP55DRAFT_218648 [Colletotrichum godetiae]|uniref:Uncharacterized protein n=1 Tax=Colletotrichum godetiae TaxID=1209918 RepID=A0AAJ0EVS7_9PEZI|nr:uncharacterized protein BDP55DRAFT_218648 [Colletotrichum godetiae]KAK1673540.1 hypothetical protein BDP55DRAFT_218648 [Colletotrichum godetiae]